MAVVFVFPILIEVQEQVYPALKIVLFEVIEVGMYLEITAIINPMQPSSEVGGIRNQVRNARELF